MQTMPPARIDDRSPYDVALAAVKVIARHSDLADEQAVMDRILEALGPASHEYLTTIARTRHSVFYYQLQELYEFGKDLVAPELRGDLCFDVGAEFARTLLAESFHPLHEVAQAKDVDFQRAIVAVIAQYATRYTGDKYTLSAEFEADCIRIDVAYRSSETVARYLVEYGLDPECCFRNSAAVIGGAVGHFASRLTAGYDPERFHLALDGLSGVIRLPVRASDRFNYRTLIQTFSGHIRTLEERQSATVEDGNLRDDLILDSALMRERWGRIRRASRTDELILLRGESGTGKSLMARKIHELSARRDKPLVEVNLTADVGSENLIQSNLFGHEKGAFTGAVQQKQGLFSLADGGTILLDEIGDAPAEVQAKLLRVLETSTFRRLGGLKDITVDVRVIAATNCDLERMVEEGTFRRDLYFRLSVIALELPPLREHPEDIPALAHFLVARAQGEGGLPVVRLPDEVTRELQRHDWPGNIRELDHALRYALALSEEHELCVDDLPPALVASLRGTLVPAGGATRIREPRADALPTATDRVIDVEALRRVIRSCNPITLARGEHTAEIPAHIDFAKRAYLGALIDELGGDLALIGRFWDRGSEKTLRNLVRSYGLVERLEAARRGRRART